MNGRSIDFAAFFNVGGDLLNICNSTHVFFRDTHLAVPGNCRYVKLRRRHTQVEATHTGRTAMEYPTRHPVHVRPLGFLVPSPCLSRFLVDPRVPFPFLPFQCIFHRSVELFGECLPCSFSASACESFSLLPSAMKRSVRDLEEKLGREERKTPGGPGNWRFLLPYA